MLTALYLVLQPCILPLEVVVALVAAWRYRHLGPAMRWLAWLTWASALMETVLHFARDANGSNWFLGPIDAALEFTFLALLYRRALAPSRVSQAIPALVVGFGLLSAYTFWQGLGVVRFGTVQALVEGALVMSFALAYFRKLLEELTVLRLDHEPLFWVSVGLLVYFAGSLLMLVARNYALQHSRGLLMQFNAVRLLLYALLNLIYLVALWMPPPTRPK